MTSNGNIHNTAADVCERLADGLESFASAAVPLRRLAQFLRPEADRLHVTRRRKPQIQPNVEPTELDRRRARQALQRSGIGVKQNGGES